MLRGLLDTTPFGVKTPSSASNHGNSQSPFLEKRKSSDSPGSSSSSPYGTNSALRTPSPGGFSAFSSHSRGGGAESSTNANAGHHRTTSMPYYQSSNPARLSRPTGPEMRDPAGNPVRSPADKTMVWVNGVAEYVWK